jgi:hypothetical protein
MVPSYRDNGCLPQIAANGSSTPQDVIAILLEGFVLAICASRVMGTARQTRSWHEPA